MLLVKRTQPLKLSELVLTDKLTVIGGASNALESIFAGPVTFQGQTTFSTDNINR